MKGADGVAERLFISVGIGSGAVPAEVIPAPPAGSQICGFSITLSNSQSNILTVFDDGTNDVWRTQTSAVAYTSMGSDRSPIFACLPGAALTLAALSAGTLQVNISYEIRPSGV